MSTTTDIDNIADIIIENINGFLIENTDALADVVIQNINNILIGDSDALADVVIQNINDALVPLTDTPTVVPSPRSINPRSRVKSQSSRNRDKDSNRRPDPKLIVGQKMIGPILLELENAIELALNYGQTNQPVANGEFILSLFKSESSPGDFDIFGNRLYSENDTLVSQTGITL
jgi:hypothetical protein